MRLVSTLEGSSSPAQNAAGDADTPTELVGVLFPEIPRCFLPLIHLFVALSHHQLFMSKGMELGSMASEISTSFLSGVVSKNFTAARQPELSPSARSLSPSGRSVVSRLSSKTFDGASVRTGRTDRSDGSDGSAQPGQAQTRKSFCNVSGVARPLSKPPQFVMDVWDKVYVEKVKDQVKLAMRHLLVSAGSASDAAAEDDARATSADPSGDEQAEAQAVVGRIFEALIVLTNAARSRPGGEGPEEQHADEPAGRGQHRGRKSSRASVLVTDRLPHQKQAHQELLRKLNITTLTVGTLRFLKDNVLLILTLTHHAVIPGDR
jgi:hypothetical protein